MIHMIIFNPAIRPVLAVAVTMTASALIFITGDHIHRNAREAITFIAAFLNCALIMSLVPAVLLGEEMRFSILEIVKGVELAFNPDPAGMVFACVSSSLWILTSLYSTGYMRGHHEKNQTGYFAAFAMCISAATGICFAANLITFFIFFEILTVATYPLVVHYRDETGRRSGRKYLAYTLISGQLFFAGIVIVYWLTGTMEFRAGGFIKTDLLPLPLMAVLFFLMAGAGMVKAGVMPFHSWLPAAMVAPTPVSALLHAVAVVKAGAFAVIRVSFFVFGPDTLKACGAARILSWFAVATILISSFIAMKQDNLKARLAFSTIGQLSYIILGVAMMYPFGAVGGLFHIVAHAFMKITLFMCAGAVYVTTGKKNISEMVGIGRQMPVTMACFAIVSVALAGFPPFVGFVSKANLVMGAVAVQSPLYAFTYVASGLLALAYLMPVVFIAFKRDIINSEFAVKKEACWPMLVPILVTTSAVILLGLAPDAGPHLYDLAVSAGQQIFGTLGVGI